MHFKQSLFSLTFVTYGILAQEQLWESDSGNVRMDAGDGTINWGSTPPWVVLKEIKDHCSSVGCHGDDVLEVDTELITRDNGHSDAKVQVSVEGSFQSAGNLGSLENLVDLAAELVHTPDTYSIEERFWHTGPCNGGNIDPCSTMETHSRDQYFQTNLVFVRVEDDEGSQLANLHLRVTIELDEDDGSGWCEFITTGGAAVAGAIDRSVVGGVFSLLSLGCSAI